MFIGKFVCQVIPVYMSYTCYSLYIYRALSLSDPTSKPDYMAAGITLVAAVLFTVSHDTNIVFQCGCSLC
jgi:hypothetical protein